MARPKGTKNKVTVTLPDVCSMSPKERLELLANLMVDRILDDQANSQKLYKAIRKKRHATLS